MNLRKFIMDNLKNIGIEQAELSAEANFIMQHLLNIQNPYIDNSCTEKELQKLNEIFIQREKGLPLQYIIGKADFMNKVFFVDKNVLIPRPETEILVLKTIEKAQNINAKKILDIGTGSGCIPIILKDKLPQATVFSCDISEKAINVARKNAVDQNQDINFIQSDLFQNIVGKFDIIVSNPPYIPPNEKSNIQKEVSFEPDLALYTKDEKGIEFYEKIISQGREYLNNGGFIIFELGINQSDMVKSIFVDYNYTDIEIIKDLDDIDRIILAKVQNG